MLDQLGFSKNRVDRNRISAGVEVGVLTSELSVCKVLRRDDHDQQIT